ncbi:50S ribosomal protein L5 [Candidatus Collierbacteria bacterium]|nr:50S ribosomal protein L5 [Candidatus Collierbacteria bacterium]
MNQVLKNHYLKTLRPKLKEELKLKSIEAVPKLTKITLNTSSAEFKTNKEFLQKTRAWLASISGQSPVETKAKNSIAAFNVREGDVVGLKVTLRSDRMYDFLQKFTTIVLPRFKDFQGVSRDSFDQQGNYSLGIKEQIVFPEVEYDKIGRIQGLEITISTNASTKEQAALLLESLGMPFVKPS